MRKGLIFWLATVLFFTAATSGVSAASFADTEGTKCETAVEVLSSLGIVEGTEEGYKPDNSLTRAEMATILLRAMAMEKNASGRAVFTDVPASHWAYANIGAAYQLGIVNGVSASEYAPDAAVTYEQAVKMVVAALGYTVQAEALGGYPSGYLAKASQLGLLKGVKTGGDMTRGDMAILLYNALDKELLLPASYGDDAYEFVADGTETLLSYYLKTEKITDTITAVPMGKLVAPARRLLSDEVAVGNSAVIMKAGETDAQNLLGVRCEIYTKHDDMVDMPVIVAAVPKAGSEILEIDAAKIESINAGKLTYKDAEGNEKEVRVSGAAVVLNGKLLSAPAENVFMPETGKVRLIQNDGGEYSLAIIESYKNHIVKSVNKEESKIIFMDNTQLILDASDNTVTFIMTDGEGKALTLDDLEEWDIVSVAQDDMAAPSIVRLYRSYTIVHGTVTEMSDDTVRIDEQEYAVALANGTDGLQLGQSAGYCLDFTGAVAAVNKNYAEKRTYGWLRGAEYTKGLDAVPQLKLFTQDGEWKIFALAERVEFNGSLTGRDAVMQNDTLAGNAVYTDGHAPMLFDQTGALIPQLVAYDTNENGEIIELHTAENLTNPSVYGTDKDDVKLGNAFSMDWYTNSQNGAYNGGWISRFNNTPVGENRTSHTECAGGVLFGRVFITEAKMFVIPMNPEDEELYKMRDISTYGLETHRTMKCISYYDVDEGYNCGAMVIRNDIANVGTEDAYPSYTAASAIIIGKSNVLNEDGETVTALKMKNHMGAEVTATVTDPDFKCLFRYANADLVKDPDWYVEFDNGTTSNDATMITNRSAATGANRMYLDAKDLDLGDVIQYQLDDYGNLTMANVCFRANYGGGVEFTASETNGLLVTAKENYYRGGTLQVHGNVDAIYDKGIFVNVNIADGLGRKTSANALHAMKKEGAFYMWDKEKEVLRSITADDVMPGDEVFVLFATTSQRLFIVYRPTVNIAGN